MVEDGVESMKTQMYASNEVVYVVANDETVAIEMLTTTPTQDTSTSKSKTPTKQQGEVPHIPTHNTPPHANVLSSKVKATYSSTAAKSS